MHYLFIALVCDMHKRETEQSAVWIALSIGQ